MGECSRCGSEPCVCLGKNDGGLDDLFKSPKKMAAGIADDVMRGALGMSTAEMGDVPQKAMQVPKCNKCGHGGVCLVAAPDASRNGKGRWMSQAYCAGCGLYGDASDNASDAIRSLRRFQGCKLPN